MTFSKLTTTFRCFPCWIPPIITSLKAQYQEGINGLKTGNTVTPKKDIRIAQEGAR